MWKKMSYSAGMAKIEYPCAKNFEGLDFNLRNSPSPQTGSDQASLQKGSMSLSETHNVCLGSA